MNTLPKTLFFDMDNTLIDAATHKVPASAVQALREAQRNGYKLCISTGREWMMVKSNEVLSVLDWDGFVLTNGQLVVDKNFREVLHVTIPRHAILKLIELVKHYGISCSFSGSYNFRITEIDEYMSQAHNFFHEPMGELEEYSDQPIDKILIYAPEGFDYSPFDNIPGIRVYPGISSYADVIAEGSDKSTGIQALLKHMGWEDDGYTAFGDSLNDMGMIQNATIGVAMGNAVEELKEVADFVTSDVGDNGIANGLRKLGYIQ